MLPSSTHSWAIHTLLTVWFCWRISAAGSERWWWGPPRWCTWSWPPAEVAGASGSMGLQSSRHRSLSHWKAWTVTGKSDGGRPVPTILVFPPGSDSRLGRLAWGISLDQSGRRIWVEGLGGKQSMLVLLFLKDPTVIDSAAHRFQAACFSSPSVCLWSNPVISCHNTDWRD